MEEGNIVKYGRVTYIDPNGDNNIGIEQENLTKYVNIYVRIPSRYRTGGERRYDAVLNGTNFDVKNDEYENILLLSDSYVNVSYNEIRDGGVVKNGELFGVETIDVSLDSQFFPVVTINFTDVRGYGLMSTMEHNYTSNKKLNASAFFNALFNFPYPIFTLEMKGYLGTTVSYDLNLLDFNTYFDSDTGNFKVRVSFIGNLYGVLGDIPMSYLLIAPYLGSSKNFEKNNYWTSFFNDYPTLFDFLSSYANLFCGNVRGNKTSVENLKKQQEIEKQITALQIIQEEYEYFKETSKSSVKGKTFKRSDSGLILIKNGCIFNNDNDYLIYEDDKNYDVLPNLRKKIDNIKNFTYNGVDDKFLNNFREDISVDDCKTEEQDGVSYDVFVLKNVKKNHNAINDEIKRLEISKINEEEIVEDAENIISNTLGIIPNIGNIYTIIMSHLSCFMKYFYDKLENINYSGKNIGIPSHIKLDVINNKLAPFTSFYDTQQKTYVYPKTIINEKMLEDVIINDIVNASNKTFTNFSTVLRTIENYRVENMPTKTQLTPIFFADYLFMDKKNDYCYKKAFNHGTEIVELIYKIFLNRINAYIRFYGDKDINDIINIEIDNLNKSLIIGDELKKQIANFTNYSSIIKKIINEKEYVNINYGYYDEDKNEPFYKQHNEKIVGTIFLFKDHIVEVEDNTKGIKEEKKSAPKIDNEEERFVTYHYNDYVDDFQLLCKSNSVGCGYINVKYPETYGSCLKAARRTGRFFFRDDDNNRSTLSFLSYFHRAVKYNSGKLYGSETYWESETYYYNKKLYKYEMHQCACLGESKNESKTGTGTYGAIPFEYSDDANDVDYCMKYFIDVKCHKPMEMFCLAVYELSLQNRGETKSLYGKLQDYFYDNYPSFWRTNNIKQNFINFFKEIYEIDIDDIEDFLSDTYYMGANFQQYECTEDQLKSAINKFQTLYASKNSLEIENSLNANERIKKEVSFQEDLKNGIYYNIKSLYDKYLSSMYYDDFDEDSALYKNVKFITPLYNDISNSLINVDRFYSQIKNVIESENSYSVIEFLSKLGQDNEFLFLVQPQTPLQDLTQIFKPDKNRINNNSGVTLLYISHCDVSHNVNIENSEYVDDGFSLTDFKNPNGITDDEVANLISDLHDYNFDAFGVTYGMQNQNIFKTININTENPSTTEHSIANIISISNQGEEVKNHIYTSSKNQLYPIYANRSYTCEVSMLGCMNITPLMIFQLNNIPLFKGAYLIYDVQHHITPSDFTTSFKGVRMSKYKIPINTKYQILNMVSIGSVEQSATPQRGEGGTETTVGTGEAVNIDTSNDRVNLGAGHSCFFKYEHECTRGVDCDCHRSAKLSVKCLLAAHNMPDDGSYASIDNSVRLLYEHQDGWAIDEKTGEKKPVYRLHYFVRKEDTKKTPKEKYEVVVNSIKSHLDVKKPVIVGVNHTYGKKNERGKPLNEGASDHWFTIYAYGYSGDTLYFRYYESGSNHATSPNRDDILLYKPGEQPLLYNNRAHPSGGVGAARRYDVTVVKLWHNATNLDVKLDSYYNGESILPIRDSLMPGQPTVPIPV